MRKRSILACLLIGLVLVYTAALAQLDHIEVEVDFTQTLGSFNRLSGVQGSPFPIIGSGPAQIEQFKAASIALCRFPQDCYPNTLTLAAIFPDADADPENPDSYNFSAIDKHVAAAAAAGCEILWQASYDIGMSDSWQGINLGGRAPRDLQKWLAVVKKCLIHFNNSGNSGQRVKYVEFINEPDGLGGFAGMRKQLADVFIAFLKMVDKYNKEYPATPVTSVGPGLPFCYQQWPSREPHFRKVLARLRAESIELPILSFHTYGNDTSPEANTRLAQAYRNLLDECGFTTTRLWNTEWQGGDFLQKTYKIDVIKKIETATLEEIELYRTALGTYALSCKIKWQGLVDGSCYYRVNQRAFPPHIEARRAKLRRIDSAFFQANGDLAAMGRQEKLTQLIHEQMPLLCQTRVSSDKALFTAQGFRAADNSRAGILLCNLYNTSIAVNISSRLPAPKNSQNWRVFSLNSSEQIKTGNLDADPQLSFSAGRMRMALKPFESVLLQLNCD